MQKQLEDQKYIIGDYRPVAISMGNSCSIAEQYTRAVM